MSDPGSIEINGLMGRARALASVLNALVIAPAVLVYVGLVASGYIPFRPLDTIVTDLQAHRTERAETDQRTTAALEALAKVVAKYERRDRLVECHARYLDVRVRDWCLTLGEDRP